MQFSDLAVGPSPQLPLSTYIRRRRELAKKMGRGNVLVVTTHPPKQFSNDVDYVFRPHSDFWYLTGFAEPHATLVLEGGGGRSTLFVQPHRKEAEIWTGRRLGVERAAAALGVDRAYSNEEFATRLPAILGKSLVHALVRHDAGIRSRVSRTAGTRLVPLRDRARPGGPPKRPRKRAAPHGITHARELIHDMRVIKDPGEMRLLQRACDLGVEAHLQAARMIRPGRREFQVEAAFAAHARHHGSCGVGYPSICGCGPNAAVLHYVTNQGRLRRGEMFLVDAGCEWGYYTSDITRTYPVGGQFSRIQEKLYDLVLEAHGAAMRKVRPGLPFRAPHEAAVSVIAGGLVEFGMLPGPVEKVERDQTYRRFFMHGTSHFLGLDVHDAGYYVEPDGKPRLLRQGMVMTVEPGLYFNREYAACPPGTQGIGIRIEDDVLVTASGRRNLTKALPVKPEAIAALVGDG